MPGGIPPLPGFHRLGSFVCVELWSPSVGFGVRPDRLILLHSHPSETEFARSRYPTDPQGRQRPRAIQRDDHGKTTVDD
jgi:hypothetical protein